MCGECGEGFYLEMGGGSSDNNNPCLPCTSPTTTTSFLFYLFFFSVVIVLWYRGSINAPPTSEGFLAAWFLFARGGAFAVDDVERDRGARGEADVEEDAHVAGFFWWTV